LAVGTVAEIKSRLDVADVVGETVALKKAGTTFKGLCPFHGEKTPSFTVTPARETWKCFGCGLGGDIFSFVMERDGIAFPEALRQLAAKAGVELDERSRRDDAHRARLRTVLETAIAFYHAVLTASKSGEPALAYLRGRGFTDETIEAQQLGWAPEGWDSMARRLIEKRDIRPEELIEVGLASPRQGGGGPGRPPVFDRFRARVIFPIRDQNGHAVGLGGRILGAEGEGGRDTGPKYLNSAATPLFDKSRTLYLIDKAKGPIRKTGQAVIVEGYTDALMAHQAGFPNVVASLGTALTPGQVGLLSRYARKIALAYDVDAAGERAGALGVGALEQVIGQLAALPEKNRAIELDEVRVVRLPDGQDPDEVLRETPDRWREEVRTAQPIVDYLIDLHARAHDLKTPGGKARFVDALLPTLRAVPNPVMRDAYLQRVRQVSGVDEGILRDLVRTGQRMGGGFGRGTGGRPGRGGAGADGSQGRIDLDAVVHSADALPIAEILRGLSSKEAELLRFLLLVPEQQLRVVESLGPDQLTSQVARELYRSIARAREADDHGVHPPFSLSGLIATLDDETAALAQALMTRREPDPRTLTARSIAYEVERLIIDLEEQALRDVAEYNQAALAEAEQATDRDAMATLLRERASINDRLRSLHRRRDQTRLLSREDGSSGGSSSAGGSGVSEPPSPAGATS
jgi:DNA primase